MSLLRMSDGRACVVYLAALHQRRRYRGGVKWHSVDAIANKLGADPGHVADTLSVMKTDGTFGSTCESKRVGASSCARSDWQGSTDYHQWL